MRCSIDGSRHASGSAAHRAIMTLSLADQGADCEMSGSRLQAALFAVRVVRVLRLRPRRWGRLAAMRLVPEPEFVADEGIAEIRQYVGDCLGLHLMARVVAVQAHRVNHQAVGGLVQPERLAVAR